MTCHIRSVALNDSDVTTSLARRLLSLQVQRILFQKGDASDGVPEVESVNAAGITAFYAAFYGALRKDQLLSLGERDGDEAGCAHGGRKKRTLPGIRKKQVVEKDCDAVMTWLLGEGAKHDVAEVGRSPSLDARRTESDATSSCFFF